MKNLTLKPVKDCKYDLISLGEIMLRFDPGEDRIHNAASFRVWEGGGEYNVAKGLSSCFGQRTAITTALVDNEIGRLIEQKMLAGKVDPSWIKWVGFDGIGRQARNGIYFMERGTGIRGAKSVFDRGQTAVSQLKTGDINWEDLFGRQGVRWFHTGGIFAGLSETTPDVINEAIRVAGKYGTIVSYDPNYRSSLWKSSGGKEASDKINRRFLPYVDVLIGIDSRPDTPTAWKEKLIEISAQYPNLAVIASTRREVQSATRNDWGAVCLTNDGYRETPMMESLEIVDRVGAGDAFATGLIYGLLEDKKAEEALNYGVIHGALTMTTPGDTGMVSKAEVEAVMAGKNGVIDR